MNLLLKLTLNEDCYLDACTESLVVLGQFGVGTGEGFNLDFVFADFGFVLLFQA